MAKHHKSLSRKVRILEVFLSICSFCKRIQTNEGDWERLEKYISEHSEAEFSHGVCMECAKKHYPELLNLKKTSC
ncbi:MAG: hypothetical protein PVI26_04500 [Chitinispirillia bacterium]